MFNPTREFLSSKLIVGLDITDRHIGMVQVSGVYKSPKIEQVEFREVEYADQVFAEVASLFQENEISYDALVTSLPTSEVFVRQISLPVEHPKMISRIIKYQLEPYIPHAIDDMVVDFLDPSPSGDVLTFGLRKKTLSDHLEELSLARLSPDMVTLDDLALSSLYIRTHTMALDEAVAIINFGIQKKVVQILKGNRVHLIRVLQSGKALEEGLAETLDIYRFKNQDVPLDEIFLTGQKGATESLPETIETLTKTKTSLWRPFDGIDNALVPMEDALQAKLSVPLSLALGVIGTSWKGINFRKEEYAVPRAISRKRMITILVAFLVILGLFTFSTYYRLSVKENTYENLRKQAKQIFLDAFPTARQVIPGQELAQMKQKIAEERAKYEGLEALASEGTSLDALKSLTQSISSFPDVEVDNLTMEGKELRLDGRAPSFEMVDNLEKSLSNSPFFERTKLVGAKIDKKDKAVRFNFALEKK
jgi:Tfp pilus assembly PilM family ATPase/Tfp pilus assembly protein PilN